MKFKMFLLGAITISLSYLYSCSKSSKPSTPTTPPSNVNLKSGLLLYLPFDGNMADSSGNNNQTAAAGGAVLGYDEHGNANSAFDGTGSGQRIIVTNNGSIKFDTAFTISMDVMIKAQQTQMFATMVQNTTGNGPSFILSASIPNSPVLDFAVPDTTNSCSAPTAPGHTPTEISQFVIQPLSWYNVIAVFHKGTLQLYVNGQLVSTLAGGGGSIAPLCPGSQVIIGGWWQGDPVQETLNGRMDEFRLYNRVLNVNEIAQLSANFH